MSLNTDIFTRLVIDDTLQEYLQELKITSLKQIKDNISSSQKEKLLLVFLRDFLSFKIDFDLLISLIGMIWI
ncbi:MAG TPA: hypothetical protein PLS49_00875, partial [Candidatus Woesebacteria bacterium]|nr:hypothetical protein [Candidatus Woesebacteria bacterium]